ncbi:MAG: hypothetical protein ABIC91_08595 [Nanoarchaeota archaeon]|nr:hypothetical protein [Nanoarchaeota archaeon]MBU1849319.1 hypothetical protein [Nanoarchaeota archaeon]
MSEKKLRKIAFITYNRIGDGQFENGVIEANGKQVFLSQNGHLSKWVASGTDEEKEKTRTSMSKRVMSALDIMSMDEVYIYVGSKGGEKVICMSKDLPVEKVSYVMCDCNEGYKKRLIRNIGNADSKIISCECGGRETMARLLKSYIS